jgi:tight adherence protein C
MTLLPIAVFFIATALCYGLALPLVRGRKSRENEIFSDGRFRPLVFGPLTRALAGLIPCNAVAKANLKKDLQRAGFYHRHAFEEFASIRNVTSVGWLLLLGTLIVVSTDLDPSTELKLAAVGVFGAILFYGVPALILRSKAKARLQRIQDSLPDALDMLTMCMTGGLPLQRALSRVSGELDATHRDLASELRIVGRHIEAGSLDGALTKFADRVDTPDVQSLTAMVRQTDSQGSSVALAFEQFGDGLRRGMRHRAEERGNKTAIKMLMPLVFCLAPPVYMLLLTPAVMELSNFVVRENEEGGILTPSALGNEESLTDRFNMP